jgi:hypothetical protein
LWSTISNGVDVEKSQGNSSKQEEDSNRTVVDNNNNNNNNSNNNNRNLSNSNPPNRVETKKTQREVDVNDSRMGHKKLRSEDGHAMKCEKTDNLFDPAVFRKPGVLVDVNFHRDGWFCGSVDHFCAKQVAVTFVNGDPMRRLVPVQNEIRLCVHNPQLRQASR